MTTRRAVVLWPLSLAACGGGQAPSATSPDAPSGTPITVNPTPSPTVPAPPATDAWRPRYHYTPQRHWMNDPNGLVFFNGEYHLYYQYNPQGAQWGNIGWGHAFSRDLVAWQEQPVAIPATPQVMAFSGSVVVDHHNSAGFVPAGTAGPALVACFTGFDPASKIQSQHLAYSLDGGRSYTPYAGNPVIDIGSTEFRDPKVFWHAASARWVMLVVAALQQQMWVYTSSNLKDWAKVSTFGPAGSAANNIWEVPELFELPVDGDAARKRWVLVISVNHGSLWGGSGVQYFVGDFDGTRFVADVAADAAGTSNPLTPLPGDLIADFEGSAWPAGWLTTGTAFGSGPAAGALDGQTHVSGHLGRGLVNSFRNGDAASGTLTSPPFTITRKHLSFLIAGGSSHLTRLELLVGNQVVVQRASGDDSEVLKWQSWDVSALVGLQAVLRVVDEASGPWGHILIDHLVMTDAPVRQPDVADITLWADHGRDFYAPITFANLPDGRVLWLGWMSNWDYARALPTEPWRGQQSLPRQLDLVTTPQGLRLRQQVAPEVLAWVDSAATVSLERVSAAQAAAALQAAQPAGRQWRARLVLPGATLQSPVGLAFFVAGTQQAVRVGFDPTEQRFFVDRSTGSPRFAGDSERHHAPRLLDSPDITLEIWVDGCTVELFADGGTVVISDLVFAEPGATEVALFHGAENPPGCWLDLHRVRAAMYASGG